MNRNLKIFTFVAAGLLAACDGSSVDNGKDLIVTYKIAEGGGSCGKFSQPAGVWGFLNRKVEPVRCTPDIIHKINQQNNL